MYSALKQLEENRITVKTFSVNCRNKNFFFSNLFIISTTNHRFVFLISRYQGTPLTVSPGCFSLLYLPIPYKFCVLNLFMITSSKLFSYLHCLLSMHHHPSLSTAGLEKLKICMHIFLYM